MAKQIPLGEFERLKKFMGLTTSQIDGEALAALRKANAVLSKHGLTWAEVLGRTVSVDAVTASDAAYADDAQGEGSDEMATARAVDDAFEFLRSFDLGKFQKFIDSIEQQWMDKRYLSAAQRRVLFDAVTDRRRRSA